MTDVLLQLEARLFVLRYGRQRVLQALATIAEQSVEELEKEVAAAESRKTRRKPNAIQIPELVADAFKDRPDLVPAIQMLVSKYENKTLFPHLRDVQRFLDRLGVTKGRLKSRQTALPQLIRAMAAMSTDEISRITAGTQGDPNSDYALLAREIMSGGSSRNRVPRSMGEKTD